jgi:putative membrane protein
LNAVIQSFVTGFPMFALHIGTALGLLILGVAIYVILTPHKELTEIEAGNAAAGLSLAGLVVGLAIPLAAALETATNLYDIAIWGAVTLLMQLAVFAVLNVILHGLSRRIRQREMGAAMLLVGAKISVALILAAALKG